MLAVLVIAGLATMALLAVQDWKHRWIRPWTWAVLTAVLIVGRWMYGVGTADVSTFVLNLSITAFMLLAVSLYAKARFGADTPIRQVFGFGDGAVMVALTLAFDVPLYPFFIAVAALLAICAYPAIQALRERGVPFVSFLTGTYILWVGCAWLDWVPAPVGDQVQWSDWMQNLMV